MQTDPDSTTHLDDPEDWRTTHLEWLDSQLSNYVHTRARHRDDVRMYARVQAHLPMRYHMAQVQQCSTRIGDLLDLRLLVMQGSAPEEDISALHPM